MAGLNQISLKSMFFTQGEGIFFKNRRLLGIHLPNAIFPFASSAIQPESLGPKAVTAGYRPSRSDEFIAGKESSL